MFIHTIRGPNRGGTIRRTVPRLAVVLTFCALGALAPPGAVTPAAAQTSDRVILPTDSLTGSLTYRHPEAFVLTTDDGREVLFEIAPDTVETRVEMVEDSVSRPVPHASVMERRDILFILGQLEESEERDRVHVHYVTVGEDAPRRVAIWISVAQSRVPGG